jgi:hypothetical protein
MVSGPELRTGASATAIPRASASLNGHHRLPCIRERRRGIARLRHAPPGDEVVGLIGSRSSGPGCAAEDAGRHPVAVAVPM